MSVLLFVSLTHSLSIFFCCIWWFFLLWLVLLKPMTSLGYAHSSAFERFDLPVKDMSSIHCSLPLILKKRWGDLWIASAKILFSRVTPLWGWLLMRHNACYPGSKHTPAVGVRTHGRVWEGPPINPLKVLVSSNPELSVWILIPSTLDVSTCLLGCFDSINTICFYINSQNIWPELYLQSSLFPQMSCVCFYCCCLRVSAFWGFLVQVTADECSPV